MEPLYMYLFGNTEIANENSRNNIQPGYMYGPCPCSEISLILSAGGVRLRGVRACRRETRPPVDRPQAGGRRSLREAGAAIGYGK